MVATIVAGIKAEASVRTRIVLEPLALIIERQAKINASTGAHKYGTPTPARPGTGPAIISGNLRRSITHSPITFVNGGWETKVGTAIGFPAPYGSKTPANKYGFYLETGLRNGTTYPFLVPAFKFGTGVPADLLYQSVYGAGWKKIL
jgi:hypothetical protein